MTGGGGLQVPLHLSTFSSTDQSTKEGKAKLKNVPDKIYLDCFGDFLKMLPSSDYNSHNILLFAFQNSFQLYISYISLLRHILNAYKVVYR